MKLTTKALERLRKICGTAYLDHDMSNLMNKAVIILDFPDQRQVFLLEDANDINAILETTAGGLTGNAYFDEHRMPQLYE